jgi:hypothetical protein
MKRTDRTGTRVSITTGRRTAAAGLVAMALSGAGAAVAAAEPQQSDPSSADGGSIAVTTTAKSVSKHGTFTVTVAGQVPEEGQVFLLWTSARKTRAACPGLVTEESFIQLGIGGSVFSPLVTPAGAFSESKTYHGGTPHLDYHFCGYVRFVGQQGDTELGDGTVVKVK